MPSSISNHLSQLLQRPVRTRVGSHIDMSQATAAVLDHHKDVQHPKRRGHCDEEVTGNDGRRVIA